MRGDGKAGKFPLPYTDEVRSRLWRETRGAWGSFLVTVKAGDIRTVMHAAQVSEDRERAMAQEIATLRAENTALREHIAAGQNLISDRKPR